MTESVRRINAEYDMFRVLSYVACKSVQRVQRIRSVLSVLGVLRRC